MKNILKKVALVLSFAMIFTAMPTTAFADTVVAKIVGGSEYSEFKAALTDANAMTGADVVVEIYGEVEFTDGMELKGNYNSITFVGKDAAAKMTIKQTAGGDYLEAHGKTVVFENLTLAKANPAWSGNSGHMGSYFSVQGGTIEYNNCVFPNGACANTSTAVYNNCTFKNTSEYGLWVYDDAIVTVNGGTIDSAKGIKVYSEGEESVTSKLTVKNATFTENVTAKPAVAIGYAESVTLIGNTYNNPTDVLELDSGSDADCEGVTFVAQDANGTDISSTLTAVDRSNSNAPCGVLVDGKIYTKASTAAADATSGSTVTLLHDSTETIEFPTGVTLDKNGHTAANVTVETPVATVNGTPFTSLQAAIAAANGAEVTLLKETTEKITLSANTVLNLNLNNNRLNGYILAKEAGTSVEIKNGEIVNDDSSESAVEAAVNLTLTNVNITSARHAVRVDGVNANATINGGTYVVKDYVSGNTQHAVNVSGNGATVVIENGTFTGPKGTTADSGSAVNVQTGSTVTIKGGNFSGGMNNSSPVTSTLSVKGTLKVSGGTFDIDPTAYLETGYEVVAEGANFKVGPHNVYAVPGTAAGCTTDGTETYYKCDFCGEMYSDAAGNNQINSVVVIPATGHAFGGWYTVKEPNCFNAGYEARMCQCGETESRPLAATTHNFDINGVCAICGLDKTTATVSAPSRANPDTGVHF